MKSFGTALLLIAGLSACGTAPPRVKLLTEASKHLHAETHHYRVGQLLQNCPPYVIRALVPTTRVSGDDGTGGHHWTLTVERRDGTDLAARLARMPLANGSSLGTGTGSAISIYARGERKILKWGTAVTCLSQYMQDGYYAPCNGYLDYEVLGVTRDHRFAVHLTAAVSHPHLPTWPKGVREYKYQPQRELERDPDFMFITKTPAATFVPALPDLDELLNGLVLD